MTQSQQKKPVQKIILSSSRDIPFDKLLLSQSNVRHIKAGVSIEELAEDIARRTLLQSIMVRPVRNAEGAETGMYEIPAGGRRYRALALLVKQRRLAKTAPVPCVVREDGTPEEDSLAENVQRAPLHPLDQFRAFLALREKGQSEEEIAANQFVSVAVVKQRLRLASVSPKLLDVYAEDSMTLDQLMAFTVNADHARQEQVFERISQSYDKQPYAIRRMLTEGAVKATDKRALFVGLGAYAEAGGTVLRDLFEQDHGGWLQDAGLLDMLVAEKLRDDAEPIAAEGWKWIEVAPDFAYGHTYGFRHLRGEQATLSDEEQATRDALQAELDGLEERYSGTTDDDVPDDVDERLGEIETAIAAFDERPMVFDPVELGRAGAFVSIDAAGNLRVERGYVRAEDELTVAPEPIADGESDDGAQPRDGNIDTDAAIDPSIAEEPEEDGMRPLPDRLLSELTAHRTLALRHALDHRPDVAFLGALHALCLRVFYRYAQETCLELDLKSVAFSAQAPGLADSALALSYDSYHAVWTQLLPKEPGELWDALQELDNGRRHALFAHCVSLSVNAIYEPYNRRPKALAHADRLATAVDLNMATDWTPTVGAYLGRVTKARILAAVREAKGEQAADRIASLKKPEMAAEAEVLLAGTGWLPESLRTPGCTLFAATPMGPSDVGAVGEQSAANDHQQVVDSIVEQAEDAEPHAIAAE